MTLQQGQELEYDYAFFHLIVIAKDGKLQMNGAWTRERKAGDLQWGEPGAGKGSVKNVGDSEFVWFVIQWREFE